MGETPWRNKDRLKELYIGEDMKPEQIAEKWDCGKSTIQRWVNKHGISKSQFEAKNPVSRTPKEVEHLYFEERKPIADIADMENCSYTAVRNFMKHHGLEPDQNLYRGGTKPAASYQMHSDGYMWWQSDIEGETSHCLVHRLLATLEHDIEELDGKHVHHKNGIPWDNRPENIEVLTPFEHNSLNHRGRPVEERMEMIREYEWSDKSYDDIADMFDVSRSTFARYLRQYREGKLDGVVE